MSALNSEMFEQLSIRELFALPLDQPPELIAGLQARDFRNVEQKISAAPEPIPWSRVQSEIAGQISAVLNSGVLDTWACAWKKYQTLKADVEESRKSPGALVLSSLAEHSIESTLHPYVDIFLGTAKIERITFDVSVTTHIKGLILGLTNGCLVSLQLGECNWTGSIAFRGISLIERQLTALDIPGQIKLKRGISLMLN